MERKPCPVCGEPVTRRGALTCSKKCSGLSRRSTRTCAVENCEQPHSSRGLCMKHVQRWRLRGETTPTRGDEWRDQTESERFWSKVDKSGDCWLWTGRLNNKGYGRFRIYGTKPVKSALAHRYVLRELGVLDESLIVMHACDTPRCVNPAHLSQGTQLDNMRDAKAKGRMDLSGLELSPTRSGAATTHDQRRRMARNRKRESRAKEAS